MIADKVENGQLKTFDVIAQLEGICKNKGDFKIAAETDIDHSLRSNFLHFWVMKNIPSAISYLFKKDSSININAINSKGETPLHLAIQLNNMMMVKLLIHLGAGLYPLNWEGSSPFNLLEEKQMEYVAQNQSLKPVSKQDNCKQIKKPYWSKDVTRLQIENVEEEVVDDMFSKMRNYFDQKGYIAQKLITDTFNSKTSIKPEENEEEEEWKVDEEWNVLDSDVTTEHIYQNSAFQFKNKANPFVDDVKESTDTTTVKSKEKYAFDLKEGYYKVPAAKIGPQSFNIIKLLGIGSFGEVFLVEMIDNGKLYAMKILRKDKILQRNLK